jgi:hypothetical protein
MGHAGLRLMRPIWLEITAIHPPRRGLGTCKKAIRGPQQVKAKTALSSIVLRLSAAILVNLHQVGVMARIWQQAGASMRPRPATCWRALKRIQRPFFGDIGLSCAYCEK